MDVAIPLILQDEGTGVGPKDIGTLLTLCSFFYLFGKISMGYSVDQFGPRFVFVWLASFASAGLTGMISVSQDAARMTMIMCVVCVAQSSGTEHRLAFAPCLPYLFEFFIRQPYVTYARLGGHDLNGQSLAPTFPVRHGVRFPFHVISNGGPSLENHFRQCCS